MLKSAGFNQVSPTDKNWLIKFYDKMYNYPLTRNTEQYRNAKLCHYYFLAYVSRLSPTLLSAQSTASSQLVERWQNEIVLFSP